MTGREHRRVVRLKLEHSLKVEIGSIGSNVKYEMVTNNISSNGFFLAFEKPGRFPFTTSSIMEVWMQLGDDKVFFNGKLARIVFPNDELARKTGPGIAIRIIQIDPSSEKTLIDYIQERLSGQNTSEVKKDSKEASHDIDKAS